MDYLQEKEIRRFLHTKYIGKELLFYETVSSTNVIAKEKAPTLNHGAVIAAAAQHAGKGRNGRLWASPPNQNIYASIVLKPGEMNSKIQKLTLITGLSVLKAIADVVHITPDIKWPNDLLVNGKKICGILTEMQAQGPNIQHIVIGCGININMDHIPDAAGQATSLLLETGNRHNCNQLLAAFLYHFEQCFEEDEATFIEEYKRHCITLGKAVTVIGATPFDATAIDLDKGGELIVQTENGEQLTVLASEVSIRAKK